MSKPLIPIAISSQLDESGEERIHASGASVVTRNEYKNYITYAYVITASSPSLSARTYVVIERIDTNSLVNERLGYAEIVGKFRQGGSLVSSSTALFAIGASDNSGPTSKSYVIYNNGGTMAVGPPLVIPTGGSWSLNCDTYSCAGLINEDTLLVAYHKDLSSSEKTVCVGALQHNGSTHELTSVAQLSLGNGRYPGVCLHNGFFIVQISSTMYALSYDVPSATFTIIDTVSLPLSGTPGERASEMNVPFSDGSYIYAGGQGNPATNYVVSFDGTTLAVVDSFLAEKNFFGNHIYGYSLFFRSDDFLLGSVEASPEPRELHILNIQDGIVDTTPVDTLAAIKSTERNELLHDGKLYIFNDISDGIPDDYASGVWSVTEAGFTSITDSLLPDTSFLSDSYTDIVVGKVTEATNIMV